MRGRRRKAESGGAILDPADVEARRLLYILGVRESSDKPVRHSCR